MSKLPYTFNEKITGEQAKFIIEMYHQQGIHRKHELDVYAAICEILYLEGFRAYLDGMYNRETNCHFNWDRIMGYKTVIDFQIDCL